MSYIVAKHKGHSIITAHYIFNTFFMNPVGTRALQPLTPHRILSTLSETNGHVPHALTSLILFSYLLHLLDCLLCFFFLLLCLPLCSLLGSFLYFLSLLFFPSFLFNSWVNFRCSFSSLSLLLLLLL